MTAAAAAASHRYDNNTTHTYNNNIDTAAAAKNGAPSPGARRRRDEFFSPGNPLLPRFSGNWNRRFRAFSAIFRTRRSGVHVEARSSGDGSGGQARRRRVRESQPARSAGPPARRAGVDSHPVAGGWRRSAHIPAAAAATVAAIFRPRASHEIFRTFVYDLHA